MSSPLPATNQRIDGPRLWDSLMEMAQIGATPKGGVRRLALGDVDRAGRARFRELCEAAGLAVRVDAMGNMFARRAGRDPGRLPVLFGSHLDSQPTGGKFDGALGVMAGTRGHAHAGRPRHRDGRAAGAGQLDRRGRQPLRPQPDGLGRVGRGVPAGRHHGARRRGRRDRRRRAGRDRLSPGTSPPPRSRPTLISSCTSSRDRSWSAKASASASSPAARRRSGTMRSPPGRTAMPAPPRRRRAGTPWSARLA